MAQNETNNQELSEKEVWDVLQFAKQMYNMFPGVYSPDILSARLKDITLNPSVGTATQIDEALKNPKNSESQLKAYGQYFELIDMLYKRQIQYLGNLLSWNLEWTFTNINKESDYNSPAFKKDEKILYEFLDKFNYKKEFKKVLKQLVRQETFFCSFRDDGEQHCLQELSSDYCKVTGRFEYGLLFDFNMQFFLNAGNSLEMYSPVFKDYWNRIMDNKNNGYVPSRQLDERTGEWVLWVQCNPTDKQWVFKFHPEIGTSIPFFAPLFPDLVNKTTIRNLQRNKYIVEASKLLVGFIGFNKDNKSGNVRDSFNLSVESAGKFANLMKNAIESEIHFGIVPFEDVKQYEWKSDGNNIYDDYTKVTVAQGGTNTRLLYATDKMNISETKASIAIDEHVVESVYGQFEDFLNFYVNKLLKNYNIKFKFTGTEMPENKQKRLDDVVNLANIGIVLPMKFASALDIPYQDFERQLEMGRAKGFVDKLTPIVSAFQTSGKDVANGKINGRPKKSDAEIGDAGATTRENGQSSGE